MRKINFLALLMLCLSVAAQAQVDTRLPEKGLCAHRGAMDTHPENTMPALKEAIRLGAQMIEFDIQITKDGKLVVMHDDTVDRTTDGTGAVADKTLVEVLKLDAGIKKGEAFKGTRVPTFEQVLASMPHNIWLNCHLKGSAAVGMASAKLLEKTGRMQQAFLTCNEEAADAAVKAVPGVLICNADNKYRSNTEVYVKATVSRKAKFIQLLRPAENENQDVAIKLLKQSGVIINFYYAKSPDELAPLFKQGVNFVLVNNLAEMLPAAASLGIQPVKSSK